MTITLTIPDDAETKFVNGVCVASGYDANSGMTKRQWAKFAVLRAAKGLALSGLARDARETVRTVIETVTAD